MNSRIKQQMSEPVAEWAALRKAAKDFYNATVGQPALRLSSSSRHIRDEAQSAGEALRSALLITADAAPVAAEPTRPDWRELLRRCYVELFHCHQQMTQYRTDDDEVVWTAGVTVPSILRDAKAALEAHPAEPTRQSVDEADISAAMEYLSGVNNRYQAQSALKQLRPDVVAELVRRGLFDEAMVPTRQSGEAESERVYYGGQKEPQPVSFVPDERKCTCGGGALKGSHSRTCLAFDESMMTYDPFGLASQSAEPVALLAQKPVATVRVTHGGYGMELSKHIAYHLPEGLHDVYAEPPAATGAQGLTDVEALRELLGHISDVLPDDAFDLIDTEKWNAASAILAASPANANDQGDRKMAEKLDLDALENLCQGVAGWDLSKAWPTEDEGVWQVGGEYSDGSMAEVVSIDTDNYFQPKAAEPLARFYAAANPRSVAALIARIRELEGINSELLVANGGIEASAAMGQVPEMAKENAILEALERLLHSDDLMDGISAVRAMLAARSREQTQGGK